MESPEESSSPSSPSRPPLHTRILSELGLISLFHCHRDVKLLCLQRFVRFFSYGLSTLILASALSLIGISDARIGLFMTLTIVGDIFISFVLALVADALGRRVILGIGSLLMTVSGIVFAVSSNFWILLTAAVIGVISPNGSEIGPFRAVEESTLAHLTHPAQRAEIIAWYLFGGRAGFALGLVSSGWLIQRLIALPDWDLLKAYRLIFIMYAACGMIKFGLCLWMSKQVEAEGSKKPKSSSPTVTDAAVEARDGDESTPLLQSSNSSESTNTEKKGIYKLLPPIEKESIPIVVDLCLLFCLDSFGSGLASATWVTYFFRRKYDLEEGKLGTLFFVSNVLAAFSMVAASSLAKRIGNIKTMVFTHLPSAIFLALIAIPSDVRIAMLFLLLRSSTSSMDTAPRTAFIAAILLPSERTAIMGTMNFVKACGTSLGPLITGVLASKGLFWVAFVSAGAVKVVYDLGMLATFLGHQLVAEREERDRAHADAALNAANAPESNDEESRG